MLYISKSPSMPPHSLKLNTLATRTSDWKRVSANPGVLCGDPGRKIVVHSVTIEVDAGNDVVVQWGEKAVNKELEVQWQSPDGADHEGMARLQRARAKIRCGTGIVLIDGQRSGARVEALIAAITYQSMAAQKTYHAVSSKLLA